MRAIPATGESGGQNSIDTEPARQYLESFPFHDEPHDAWHERALAMLTEMDPNG